MFCIIATLASLHSSTENWYLHDKIKSLDKNFWLGMYKEGPDGMYMIFIYSTVLIMMCSSVNCK